MSKPKQVVIGKSSKASLESRGLSTLRPGSLDGCYSLYSTDSEDNVSGVNRGLDKCAELLTNILEIKSEGKVMRRSAYTSKQHMQQPALKNKQAKSVSRPKSALTRTKPKTTINIPTGKSQQSKTQRSKTAYNERVVASTPVLTTEQRKHLQELQKKEHTLKEQIQLLQEEYQNLDLKPSITGISDETSNTKQPFTAHDNNSEFQESKSSRRSLDFCSSAEKPFVEDPGAERNSSTNTEDSPRTRNEVEKTRKVQFARKSPELKTTESNIPENTLIAGNKDDQTPGKAAETTGHSPSVESRTDESRRGYPQFDSPQKYSDHLRILAYLVGELRAILASSGDNEVHRLLSEIESEIRLLTSSSVRSPRPSTGRKERRPSSPRGKSIQKQHDIDTEIAMQPLRSENSDLRRKLRIANQRTKDLEEQVRNADENKKYPGEEGIVEQLHKQLFLEKENVTQLRQQNEQAEKVIAQRNIDYSNLQELVAEKDEELVNVQEELKRHRSKTKIDVDYHRKHQLESMEMTVRAKNKEVELLKLAIDQRDAEIDRLTELTRGLQQSLTRVLTNVQDIHPEDVLSDVSMLSGIESWQPMKVKQPNVLPSMVSTAATRVYTQARVFTDHPPTKVHSDEELDLRGDNREYPRVSSPVQGRMGYRRISIDSAKDDETTISVSSADEFVFKQELANLDTVIARLQQSLRSKCAESR